MKADTAVTEFHFIHCGKTGGTAIKAALEPMAGDGVVPIKLHPHQVTLRDIPRGDRFFFVLRDPVDRFVSAFYSRQRQGRPRYDYPWSREEEAAFAQYPTADSLAQGLSSPRRSARLEAKRAMRTIGHVRDSYWKWFSSPRYFEKRAADALAILWLPSLGRTFSTLCVELGLDPDIVRLPTSDVETHRNPASVDRNLSEEGRRNLREWYAVDYAFVQICRELPCFYDDVPATEQPHIAADPVESRL